MKAVLYTDGGARPTNPGHAGFACVVTPEVGKEVAVARYIGWKTNNVAEYMGLIVGIKTAHTLRPCPQYLHIVTDSQLVMNHVLGNWKCKKDDLKPLLREAQDLLKKLFGDNWHIEWVKGHGDDDVNNRVDALCTGVILDFIQSRRANNPFTVRAGLR